MRTARVRQALALGLVLAVASCSSGTVRHSPASVSTVPKSQTSSVPAASAATLAADAYIWGSPLVISMRTVQSFARVIGVNHLAAQPALSDPTSRLIVAPNVDTLYSVAVLDLRDGPLVLTVPAIHDRYYVYQFLDMYTESFAYVGTRATGGAAGSWVIAAPGWPGTAPAGDQVIKASTPIVFLLGRFLVSGPADVAAAHRVMKAVQLGPLVPAASAGSGAEPAPAALGPPVGTPQSVSGVGAAFFNELGDDLSVNPPTSIPDKAALARFAAIGVGLGRHPADATDPAKEAMLAQGVSSAAAQIRAANASTANDVNGWETNLQLGQYGDDFLLRAEVAQGGWGANIPVEAVYLRSARDAEGRRYSGANRYVLHFASGSLPPARAFWSVTLYGPDLFLVENAEHRYAIGDRTPNLTRNTDGSLDIYIQHDPPAGHESNWLPAPAGAFNLIARIYLPEASVLDGSYRFPAVQPAG